MFKQTISIARLTLRSSGLRKCSSMIHKSSFHSCLMFFQSTEPELKPKEVFEPVQGLQVEEEFTEKPEIPETPDEPLPKEKSNSGEDHSFKALTPLIDERLIKAIEQLGFTTMTSVQAKSIQPIMENTKGMIARAKTGTGKTLAFGIPLLNETFLRPQRSRDVLSLIIAPTRDLATQIANELGNVNKNLSPKSRDKYARNKPLGIVLLVGGLSRGFQIKDLVYGKPSIVVATPGRFLDLINEPEVQGVFKNLKYMVLDEADRLLDQGFRPDLIEIQQKLNDLSEQGGYRTLLFSATIDREVRSFADTVLGKDHVYINTVDPNEPETHEKIDQSLIVTEDVPEAFASAINFIEANIRKSLSEGPDAQFKPIVFLPTVKAVDYFGELLQDYLRNKFLDLSRRDQPSVMLFHGKLTQSKRERTVRNFKQYGNAILVTTDVGARGMDFPKVSHVIQLNLPSDTSNYVHRIGRTGRASASGSALLIITEAEVPGLKSLANRKIKFAEKILSFADSVPEGSTVLEDVANISREIQAKDNSLMYGATMSLFGYFRSIASNYRMNFFESFKAAASLFTKFSVDGRKPTAREEFWGGILGLNRRQAEELFEMGRRPPRDFSGAGEGRSFGARDGEERSFQRKDYGDDRRKSYGDDRRKSYGDDRRSNYGDDRRKSFSRGKLFSNDRRQRNNWGSRDGYPKSDES